MKKKHGASRPIGDGGPQAVANLLVNWPRTLSGACQLYDYLMEDPIMSLIIVGDSELVAKLLKLKPTKLERAVAAVNSRVQSTWGFSGSSTSVRRYKCYLCQEYVARDSARHRATKHALLAVDEHMGAHAEALGEPWPSVIPAP